MEALDLSQNSVLKAMVDRLVKAFQPEVIYLFGSVARGQAGPDSDYDIMVMRSGRFGGSWMGPTFSF